MPATWLAVVMTLGAASVEHHGRVVGVADGDTLTLLTANKQQLRIRLSCIDAPEKNQAYGKKSKKALSELAFGKEAIVIERDQDRYGRIVGDVIVGELQVNKRLVKLGMAWVYRKYCTDETYLRLETAAREAKVGLWSLPDEQRLEPWNFRREKHGRRSAPLETASELPTRCGKKRYCKEMVDCAEARFYLTECGVGSLDRDKDGVPCESLCD